MNTLLAPPASCPKCGSEKLSVSGRSPNYPRRTRAQPTHYLVGYKCGECGMRFTQMEPAAPIRLEE
jgi:DNA-directed RNA polymerase subunit RPC12/RpoP